MAGSYQARAAAAALPLTPAALAVTVLTLAGACSRLWNLHLPATPVFDETHVGRYLAWYADGAFFFDVHGPLAKLLMYWTSTALGFEGRGTCPYESTEPYAAECSLSAQRLVPALAGAAMVPLTFATCCAMRLHPLAALLASWFVLIDTLFLGLSRLHLNDMVQMAFIALAHLLALGACELAAAAPRAAAAAKRDAGADAAGDAGADAGAGAGAGAGADDADAATAAADADADADDGSPPPRSGARVVALLAGTGLALGCALQCKYAMAMTTLAWLGLQNLHTLGRCVAQRRGARATLAEAALRGALLLGIPLALHLALLRLHFWYVPGTGNGDGYMSAEFQARLQGNAHAASVPAEAQLGFAAAAWEHARQQIIYNRNMAVMFPRGSHPYDSAWYTWPLGVKGVYFNLVSDWQRVAAASDAKHTFGFYLGPNPAVLLLTTAAAALTALVLTCRLLAAARPWAAAAARSASLRRLAHDLRPGGSGSLLVGWLLHWLPYATQSRQTFLHYYLPAYYFAILLAARVWHATGCAYLNDAVGCAATLALVYATGRVAWQIAPIAFGSAVRLDDWTAALRLASTDCWFGVKCWAS